MSIVTSIFSALGNNSSLYPIILKDGIDNGARTVMAYEQGAKNGHEYGLYDARERFIDENVTSVVWIGGIPTLKLLYDKFVTNKVYNFSDYKQLGSTFDKKGSRAMANTNVKLLDGGLQTFEDNIAELEELLKTKPNATLQKLVEDSKKIIKNEAAKAKFKKLYAGKMAVSSIIPLVTIGFVLPKLIQALTKSIYKDNTIMREEQARRMAFKQFGSSSKVFNAFKGSLDNKEENNVSFKGNMGNFVIDLFNNNVSNQALLDGGIFAGRVATGVNLADRIEKGIKEIGVIFFIYFGGTIVGNMLEKLAQGLGMPISLDSQILEDETFQKEILKIAKENPTKQEALKNSLLLFTENEKGEIAGLESFQQNIQQIIKSDDKESLIKQLFTLKEGQNKTAINSLVNKITLIATKEEKEQAKLVKELFILKSINDHMATAAINEEFANLTLKAAQKTGLIELIEGVKNPLQYIETDKVKSLNNAVKEYVEKALSKGSAENVEKFLKQSVITKRLGIVANLTICTLATAWVLPKLQYLFREKYTNSSNLPSLETYDKQIKAERFAGRMA